MIGLIILPLVVVSTAMSIFTGAFVAMVMGGLAIMLLTMGALLGVMFFYSTAFIAFMIILFS